MRGVKLFFTLLAISLSTVYSQDIDLRNEEAVYTAYGPSNYFFLGKYPLNVSKLKIDDIRSRAEIDLKTSLVKKIISNVKVENKSKSIQLNINDNNDKNKSSIKEIINFEFNSNIESELTLREPKIIFKEYSESKYLYGLIYIDKKEFLEQNFARLKYNIIKLVGEIGALNISNNGRALQIKYNDFIKERNKIYSFIEIQNTFIFG